MADAAVASEPSVPEVREKQHLPPKSYADAVEETPNGQDTQENGEADGHQGADQGNVNGKPAHNSTRQKASVLRIVSTDTQEDHKTEEKKNLRPDPPSRGVSKEEYSATVYHNPMLALSISTNAYTGS